MTVETVALYTNIGICHAKLSDYSKAALYLEKAESVYSKGSLPKDERYINLLNSIASTYFYLGQKEKSDMYFKKGYELTKSSYSTLSMNFINSYAVTLANAGRIIKGEEVLRNLMERTLGKFGPDSREYIQILKNYAEYIRTFRIDLQRSLLLYNRCTVYAEGHPEDVFLNDQIWLGYAFALSDNGKPDKALEIVQRLIFQDKSVSTVSPINNPDISALEPNQWTLNILRAKHRFLHEHYNKFHDFKYLLTAGQTSELIIDLVQKVRMNISEEESRLILGDEYRNIYISAIRDYDLCYRQTGDDKFLLKAFEYAEKSKVASLLASARELKATQFNIPVEIADLEKRLRDDISYYNEQISREKEKKSPDLSQISSYNNLKLETITKRDSLISVLEEKYPRYYDIKYNTEVIKPEDIPDIGGRKINYLNYVVSDSAIYIFLINRKHKKLVTLQADSVFFDKIKAFRDLVSNPGYSGNARADYEQFQETGIYLYRLLVEPVKQYLISDKLLISPDNILSYIPFETLPVSVTAAGQISYSDLHYLFKDFLISYTYSATFLAETFRTNNSPRNKTIAFAPVYTGATNLDSLILARETGPKKLYDLPYARAEAESVAKNTGGVLYLNEKATESAYKAEAGKYDIIHLAMHTAVNDMYPMYSKMIFYANGDTANDGYLNTWEVYGIPLKAKMVVLSSCNTGTGQLHSGEGILSLARGFIYSGSQSVLMSMWEVEDKSGTEVVEGFYKYLRSGADKSVALRKARSRYLKDADMLGSHPYFWSALLIYGNNSPLYFSKQLLFRNIMVISMILLALAVYHLRRR